MLGPPPTVLLLGKGRNNSLCHILVHSLTYLNIGVPI